jgi:NitT/TauT family transport system substrate-binding protein
MPDRSPSLRRHYRPLARAFLLAPLLALLAACSPRPPAAESAAPGATPAPTRIVVQLDWVPEPEHGGFFQAQARGWFAAAGLEVELLPGGANTFGPQKVATNQAHVGQADSTTTLLAIAEGLPLVHVGAVFQNDPSVLMLHADNPVKDFADLAGQTIMARPEWVFLPYLKKKYGVAPNIIPQNFQVANFIADPNFIQQGFYIAEPYHIMKGGAAEPRYLYVWDAGFDAYTALYANRAWARQNGPALRAFLAAYAAGWRDYLEGDPTPGHDLMKKANPNNTDPFLAWSREMIRKERLVGGRAHPAEDLSRAVRIEPARFAGQIATLEELGLVPPGKLTPDTVMTTEFLP